MDSQLIEVLGRNRLVDELLQAGLDVAVPVRQDGISLVVYARSQSGFVAVPIQLRASAGRKFTIDHSHELPSLIYTFVWGVGTDKVSTYALTPKEMQLLAESTGYGLTQTSQKALYDAPATRSLLDELERYRMSAESWKKKIDGVTALAAIPLFG